MTRDESRSADSRRAVRKGAPRFGRPRSRSRAAAAIVATATLAPLPASAQHAHDEEARAGSASGQDSGKTLDPFRGSTLSFEQSISTQTAHIEQPEQSYVPFYGWWVSLRPRYYFTESLRVQMRIDYYKEFTNSEQTTYYREDELGDTWTDLVYSTPLAHTGRLKDTKVTAAARVILPTSKESRGRGVYFGLGAIAGVSQKVRLLGEDAPALSSARFGVTFYYLHPFSTATTPTDYGNFAYLRQNDDGQPSLSDQLTGQTLVAHQLSAVFDVGLQITQRLGLTLDFSVINQWHYPPTSGTIAITTGSVTPPRIDDHQFTQLVWGVAALDYELFEEMSVGIGYYNVANALASDGTLRSPFGGGQDNLFWSPDARLFFDITANLDKIARDIYGPRSTEHKVGQTADAARVARRESIAAELR